MRVKKVFREGGDLTVSWLQNYTHPLYRLIGYLALFACNIAMFFLRNSLQTLHLASLFHSFLLQLRSNLLRNRPASVEAWLRHQASTRGSEAKR